MCTYLGMMTIFLVLDPCMSLTLLGIYRGSNEVSRGNLKCLVFEILSSLICLLSVLAR